MKQISIQQIQEINGGIDLGNPLCIAGLVGSLAGFFTGNILAVSVAMAGMASNC